MGLREEVNAYVRQCSGLVGTKAAWLDELSVLCVAIGVELGMGEQELLAVRVAAAEHVCFELDLDLADGPGVPAEAYKFVDRVVAGIEGRGDPEIEAALGRARLIVTPLRVLP